MIFKCAENEEHIRVVNLTADEVEIIVDMLMDMKIPIFMPQHEIMSLIQVSSSDKLHDIAHMLIDDLINAFDKGLIKDGACGSWLNDYNFWVGVIGDLRKKQLECRHGTDPDAKAACTKERT